MNYLPNLLSADYVVLGVGFTLVTIFPRVSGRNNSHFVKLSPYSKSRPVQAELTSGLNMAKLCANLAFMFTDKPLLERYMLAKNAGFKAVETGFPFGFTQEQVVQAKNAANIEQTLINTYTGDVTKGELGFAAIPGKEEEFRESLDKTISYAKALGVKKIHIMSGKVEGRITPSHDTVYENNLKYAISILGDNNITGLIEPINKYSIPGYYLNCYKKALKIIRNINCPHLRIMLDVFHLQQIQGDITHTIQQCLPYVGHVQIAQVPNRNEPDTPGEVNYQYILKFLKEQGYEDWIGLEYKPEKNTVDGLKWIKDFGYVL